MLLHWTKYAEKLGEKGSRIMESLLLMNDPTLEGTKITIELPNEGSKIDFDSYLSFLISNLFIKVINQIGHLKSSMK